MSGLSQAGKIPRWSKLPNDDGEYDLMIEDELDRRAAEEEARPYA